MNSLGHLVIPSAFCPNGHFHQSASGGSDKGKWEECPTSWPSTHSAASAFAGSHKHTSPVAVQNQLLYRCPVLNRKQNQGSAVRRHDWSLYSHQAPKVFCHGTGAARSGRQAASSCCWIPRPSRPSCWNSLLQVPTSATPHSLSHPPPLPKYLQITTKNPHNNGSTLTFFHVTLHSISMFLCNYVESYHSAAATPVHYRPPQQY